MRHCDNYKDLLSRRKRLISEIEWVESIASRLEVNGELEKTGGQSLRIAAGVRLPYTHGVVLHREEDPSRDEHETELLLYDQIDELWWTPRVVLECKLSKVTPHDAFSYSATATTHKRAHPYLRYGILLGRRCEQPGSVSCIGYRNPFDFTACWEEDMTSRAEWESFVAILAEEIQVSRNFQEVQSVNR